MITKSLKVGERDRKRESKRYDNGIKLQKAAALLVLKMGKGL